MQEQGTQPARVLDETAALTFAMLTIAFFLALGFVGRVFAPFSKGPVRWEVITPHTAVSIIRSYVTGPECLTYLQQASVELKGRSADVTVPGMGEMAVHSRGLGEYTVQPLTVIHDVEGCRWSPQLPVGPYPE